MITDQFQPVRLPSQVIGTPDAVRDQYNQWLQDWQKRYDALASTAHGAGPSLNDLINQYTQQAVGNLEQTQPGLGWTPSNDSLLTQGIVGDITNGLSGVHDQGPAMANGQPSPMTGYQDAAANYIGQDNWNNLVNYSPEPAYTPDFSSLNAEKAQKSADYQSQIQAMQQAQQTQQNAYSNMTGGGTQGGVIQNGSTPQGYQNVALPSSQAAPNSLSNPFMPWNSPGYQAGGLGGLGGYNPNPWATGSTANSQNPSGYGGPFANKNPFSLSA